MGSTLLTRFVHPGGPASLTHQPLVFYGGWRAIIINLECSHAHIQDIQNDQIFSDDDPILICLLNLISVLWIQKPRFGPIQGNCVLRNLPFVTFEPARCNLHPRVLIAQKIQVSDRLVYLFKNWHQDCMNEVSCLNEHYECPSRSTASHTDQECLVDYRAFGLKGTGLTMLANSRK